MTSQVPTNSPINLPTNRNNEFFFTDYLLTQHRVHSLRKQLSMERKSLHHLEKKVHSAMMVKKSKKMAFTVTEAERSRLGPSGSLQLTQVKTRQYMSRPLLQSGLNKIFLTRFGTVKTADEIDRFAQEVASELWKARTVKITHIISRKEPPKPRKRRRRGVDIKREALNMRLDATDDDDTDSLNGHVNSLVINADHLSSAPSSSSVSRIPIS